MGKEGIERLHAVWGNTGYKDCMMYGERKDIYRLHDVWERRDIYRLHDAWGNKGDIGCMMYGERMDI